MPTKTTDERRRRYLEAFIGTYIAHTPSSRSRREETWPTLADPRSSQGFSSQLGKDAKDFWLATKAIRYPIVADRCTGPHVWDVDQNRYIDFCLGFGTHLFGHRPDFLEQAIHDQLARGLPMGFQAERANEVAAAITTMTGVDRLSFCNTGAEAIMGAVRLARAATGRNCIVVFKGSYHGSYDAVLPAIGQTYGLVSSHVASTLVLEYGADRSLDAIVERAGDIAGILVEPVQASRPDLQSVAFLGKLRQLTKDKGIPLIFDDILLGFRIHQGGSQRYLDICADIVTYGKVIGGGMPVGIVAGEEHFLDRIDGGRWSGHDDTSPSADKIWFAGTFTKNPMTMATTHAVAQRLIEAGNGLQEGLNHKTARLVDRLSVWLTENEIPIRIGHFGSMFRLLAPPWLWLLVPHLRMRGIYVFDGMSFFLSTAHTDENIESLEEAIQDSLLAMRDGGFLS